MRYQNLLSPIMIGGQIIKNRLTYPNASPHFLQGPETYPAEGYRAFAANLAKNGAAIVNFAEWDNYPAQRQGPVDMDMVHMQAFDMSDPAVHNYVSQMCEEVHFYGSKILISAIPCPNPQVEKKRTAILYDYKTSGIDYDKGELRLVDGTHFVRSTEEELARWTAEIS